jgi:hypothetical protein
MGRILALPLRRFILERINAIHGIIEGKSGGKARKRKPGAKAWGFGVVSNKSMASFYLSINH